MTLLKFTDLQKNELKKIIVDLKVPFSFTFNLDNSIDVYCVNNPEISYILKKTNTGYRMDFVDSSGKSGVYEKPEWPNFLYFIRKWVGKVKKDNPFHENRIITIEKLSPEFYNVFHEGKIIFNLGLDNSSEMIFRKSLEILVKDFLFKVLPLSEHPIIKEKTLGVIITYYFNHKNELEPMEKFNTSEFYDTLQETKSLIRIIDNTFKIGNDFAHYERRMMKFTSIDLINNINKIIGFIDHLLSIGNLKEKIEFLNFEFTEEELLRNKY